MIKETPAPEKTPPAESPWDGPVPTMVSGYGGLTEADWKKAPSQILREHEETIRAFATPLSQKDLTHQLKLACRHDCYVQFIALFPGRKWGEKGVEDFVEFELWLKKKEISQKRDEMKRAAAKTSPAPPAQKTPAPTPAVTAETKSSGDNGDTGLGTVTPEERKAYKNYWKKFQAPEATTPSPSSVSGSPSPPAAVITPDVKKRLDLEGLVQGGCMI